MFDDVDRFIAESVRPAYAAANPESASYGFNVDVLIDEPYCTEYAPDFHANQEEW
jgi:hypothetical protein